MIGKKNYKKDLKNNSQIIRNYEKKFVYCKSNK